MKILRVSCACEMVEPKASPMVGSEGRYKSVDTGPMAAKAVSNTTIVVVERDWAIDMVCCVPEALESILFRCFLPAEWPIFRTEPTLSATVKQRIGNTGEFRFIHTMWKSAGRSVKAYC